MKWLGVNGALPINWSLEKSDPRRIPVHFIFHAEQIPLFPAHPVEVNVNSVIRISAEVHTLVFHHQLDLLLYAFNACPRELLFLSRANQQK